jgi:hypothetical protein
MKKNPTNCNVFISEANGKKVSSLVILIDLYGEPLI